MDRINGWPIVYAFNKAGITTADVIKPIRKTSMDLEIQKVFEVENGPEIRIHWISSFLKRVGN